MAGGRSTNVTRVGLAATALRVQFQDPLVGIDAWHRRVRRGELAEEPREPGLRRVVEMPLVAQEDHLVLEQCVPDEADVIGGQVRTGLNPGDLGPDVAGDLADVDVSHAAPPRRSSVFDPHAPHDRLSTIPIALVSLHGALR
jgi:hypothetical protein